jgi:hypothetical protein
MTAVAPCVVVRRRARHQRLEPQMTFQGEAKAVAGQRLQCTRPVQASRPCQGATGATHHSVGARVQWRMTAVGAGGCASVIPMRAS